MHVYYKFGLLLIFILSVSTCYTRAAPAANQSSSYDDNYPDNYNDYYDDIEAGDNDGNATVHLNRLNVTKTTTTTTPTTTRIPTTFTSLFSKLDIVTPIERSNHVLEPNCPKACLCLEDYKYIQCANAQLTQVPSDLPSSALIIDLSQNHIGELRVGDFANCSKVREINLNGNQLKQVKKENFEGLRRLQRLRLADNQLTEIEPDTFAGATDLSVLDLSNNSIMLKSEGSFLNQPALLELACRNCNWTQLYDDTFANLSSLTSLKLDLNDFSKKINTKAFTPLRNLIKLKLPELEQDSVQELCNLLKSIDNISFKHFDISCFELVLGASFNDSLIAVTDPPYKPPPAAPASTSNTQTAAAKPTKQQQANNKASNGMTDNSEFLNLTLPTGATHLDDAANATILTAGVVGAAANNTQRTAATDDKDKVYQVPISRDVINLLLICIIIVAIVGIIIGIIFRKDVGGIKTKCCRTRKPEPKDQVHPAEEIPLNKLA